jgi:electron transfer flavoprotein alpha subunit
MKNIAVFVDFKSGIISPRSLQTLYFVQAIQNSFETKPSVSIYTFDNIQDANLPILHDLNLFKIDGLDKFCLLSIKQIDCILDKLISDNCTCIIGSKSSLTDAIFAGACNRLNLPIISQVIRASINSNSFDLTQNIYSSKAVACFNMMTACIIQLNPAFEYSLIDDSNVQIKSQTIAIPQSSPFTIHDIHANSESGPSLADATFVVGAGRGLKDPANWNMIEDLASSIGAATACSKPVSDINWRPHSEHVGQTGIKIAPKLYIACGISGAIQHLAGVNASKTIIVINNDPEAPFFKYADYGIVGDVFDVIPEILKNI